MILHIHPHIAIVCTVPLVGHSDHAVGADSRPANSQSHKMLILVFIIFGTSMVESVGVGASMELLGYRCTWRLVVMHRS